MAVGNREVGDGIGIDATMQHIGEAPYWQGDGETVDVVDDSETGTATTEGVPVPGHESERECEREGQTTLDEWGWSG